MPTGKVARFFVRKGFGFIKPDDSEEEIFVHHSGLGADGFKTLADGEAVEYEVDDSGGKPRAINVTGPGGGAVQGVQRGGRKSKGGKGNGGMDKDNEKGKGCSYLCMCSNRCARMLVSVFVCY